MKTLVQCDFDGTITAEDTSFFLLDSFAQGDWRSWLQEYREHRIPVGEFNIRAFSLIKADKTSLLEAIEDKIVIRPGFHELVDYCSTRGFRFVIVSNGLDFYIEDILKRLGLERVEFHAARTYFDPRGLRVQYIGPDGRELRDNFKEAYLKLFLNQGYQVAYVGNGDSDISPAKQAHHVFARGELLDYFQENGLPCQPFEDLRDVVRALKSL